MHVSIANNLADVVLRGITTRARSSLLINPSNYWPPNSLVHAFIDDEAEESSCDESVASFAEEGYFSAFDDLLPVDSFGRPFVRIIGQRLVKIISDEYFGRTAFDQNRIIRQTKYYNYIIKSQH